MARTFIWMILMVMLNIMYGVCNGRGCTCRKYTKYECESTQELQVDGTMQSVCSWEATHGRCRNTNWLECKQDPNCIWIKKTVDTSLACDDDQQDEDGEEQEIASALNENSENDENSFVIKTELRRSSIEAGSTYIQVASLCIVFLVIVGGALCHVYKNRSIKQGVLSSNDMLNARSRYSTF